MDAGKWKYVELRPTSELPALDGAVKSPACYLHMLDLRPAADELCGRHIKQRTAADQTCGA